MKLTEYMSITLNEKTCLSVSRRLAKIDRHEFQAEELQLRDQQLLHGQLLQQNLELREAHQKSLSEMEELKKFQSSTFDTIARRRLVDQTLFWNFLAEYRICKMK